MQNNHIRLETYRDEEVKDAIQELFGYQSFLNGMHAFLPAQLYDLIIKRKDSVVTAHDFQKDIIYPFLKFIIKSSITAITASGLEQLDPQEKYLFISNHRDIGLDSAFLNMMLFDHGFQTSQIAIGDNLMKHRIAELIFRINKSFVVKRTGNPRQIYEYSVRMSHYIHDLIIHKKDSVWIAQREGRAKDGNDCTQVSLLKMLSLSTTSDLKHHFRNLHIVPVAISYEYDPCGMLKTQEFLKKQADPHYKKSFQEDMQHIMLGLKGNKGKVHIHFGKPLVEEFDAFDAAPNDKQKLETLAAIIDKSIHLYYKLHPVNYIAYDLLNGTGIYIQHYTKEEWAYHMAFFERQILLLPEAERDAGQRFLLSMYANPLVNAVAYEAKY